MSPKSATLVDGAIAIGLRTQTIRDVGPLALVRRRYQNWPVVSVDEAIILPAFSDAHTHWTQYRIRKDKKFKLLKWLDEVAFPEEEKFDDIDYACEVAYEFFEDLLKQGTLTAFIFSSPHFDTIEVLDTLPYPYNAVKWFTGPSLMNTNIPEAFMVDRKEIMDKLRDVAFKYSKSFSLNPRYALVCDYEFLYTISGFALDGTFVQTHLAEIPEEFEIAKKLHPEAKNYTDVFYKTGLLSDHTILAHCIYLEESDWRTISAMNALVAHLPLANETLQTGRMPLEKLRKYQIRWALGTDVGAGHTLSMLAVMQCFLRTHEKYTDVSAVEALYRATRALPEFMGLSEHGRIIPGAPANLVMFKHADAARQLDPEKALRLLLEGSVRQLENRSIATIAKGQVVYGEIPEFMK